MNITCKLLNCQCGLLKVFAEMKGMAIIAKITMVITSIRHRLHCYHETQSIVCKIITTGFIQWISDVTVGSKLC